MSIISKKKQNGPRVADVIKEVSNIFSDHRGDLFTADTANAVIGLESLHGADLANAQSTFESIKTKLEDAGLRELIIAQMNGVKNEEVIDVAMESAVMSMMGGADPATYYNRYLNGNKGNIHGAISVDTSVAGITGGAPALESFTVNNFDKFIATSVVVNALSLAQSNFDELFFPTEIVPAGNSGVSVTLRVPYAYNRTKRAGNGAPYALEKKPLIHALEDATILESETTLIVPNGAATANNDSFLVPVADVGNKVVVINGQDVQTRPLLFGKDIDLLGVSAHPAVIGADVQDETDNLDPSMSIGRIYVKFVTESVATPANTGVFEFNVDGNQGALFTRPAEHTGNSMTVNYNGLIRLTNYSKTVAELAAASLEVEQHLGLTDGDEWSVEFNVDITGKANTETGMMRLYANSISIGTVSVQGDRIGISDPRYTTLTANTTASLIGYTPRARRINAILRTKGIYIDNSESNSYYFAISIGSPIAAAHPVSGGGSGASVDGLIQAVRIRSSNSAVATLLAAADRIRQMAATGTVMTNATTIGSNFVRPSYIERSVDVKAELAIRRSKEGYEDLRAFIVDELTTIADKLALESSYLSALENFMAGDKEYEVIIGTDPRIANLLMISGDERTLGGKHPFRIESSFDMRMRGKIYISFRRVNRSGIDALSFGAHLSMPPLVHEVANASNGGGTITELQVQPRELHVATLPVLGLLTITNLDEYHKRN